jgi:hypothetical protein
MSVWGEPVDPWFRAPLWLRGELRGHTVWAFNQRHLEAAICPPHHARAHDTRYEMTKLPTGRYSFDRRT